jgi:hypothetical protein
MTNGFLDETLRLSHYGDHASDFGATSDIEYEQMADRFLGGPKLPGVFECTRKKGDIVRYDPATNELGVLSSSLIIYTYFKPKFCSSATPEQVARRKCHNQKTHLDYAKLICLQH